MVMFKIGMGICVCHGLKRLIVVKKGYCKIGNDEIKKEKRSKRLEGSVNRNIKSNSQGNDSKRAGNDNDRSNYKISRKLETNKGTKRILGQSLFNRSRERIKGNENKTKQFNRTGKGEGKGHNFFRKQGSLQCSGSWNNGRVVKSKGKTTRKPTGELVLFKEIYEERGPYSQISGEYVEFNVWCFSHILPKGNYSRFRLDKRNIIIKTPQEHHAWHTETHKLKLLPEWKWVFELYEQLKIEYNERKHNNI